MNTDGKKLYNLVLLAGAATMLQGCVAAVIPVAAGSLMGGSAVGIGGDDDRAELAAVETDPSVTVETAATTPRFAESTSISQPQPSAVMTAPDQSEPAQSDDLVDVTTSNPVLVSTPQPEPAQIAAVDSGVGQGSSASATDEFNTAFAEADNAPAVVSAEAEATPIGTTEPRELVENVPTEAPVQMSAESAPIEDTQVRRIAVDSSVALADSTTDAPSVSAAQAAAALTAASVNAPRTEPAPPMPAEPEPAPTALAEVSEAVEVATSAVEGRLPPATTAEASAPAVEAISPAPQPEPALAAATSAPDTTALASASSVAETALTTSAETAPSRPALSEANAITSLISYANQRKFEFTPGEDRTSAMLLDRITLAPERANCIGIQPTVLIDLDPAEGTFSPVDAGRPPAGLATGLGRLRAAGVAIAWISRGSSSFSEIYRDALARSGLDESGADQLLLMRGPDDRKQIRREQLAQLSCLIAIAGDARSDFDELYDYLLNPSDAASLEPIIGEGWFLIPTPLLSERPNP